MMVINICMIVDTITSPNLLLFTSHDSPFIDIRKYDFI